MVSVASELVYQNIDELGDEIESWFSNDEGLYNAARDAVRRTRRHIYEDDEDYKAELKEANEKACAALCELAKEVWPNVYERDMDKVKWHKMIESFE